LSSSTFASLGAPADIVDRLAARGIVDAFPIQTATVPDALAGRDICGRAPTGSGKTIAFGIPLIARVSAGTSRRPSGLVLVPTRELAAQVGRELQLLAGPRGRSVLTVYGGVGFGPQVDRLRRGVDIVVACPGRLADLVRQQHVSLDRVELVVIDEADRMADMGFLPEVRRLLEAVPQSRQTLLFSATLDGDVDVLVRKYQRNPVRHELATEHTADRNRHVFWKTNRAERAGVLADVLNAHWPAIVFCRTKHGADRLAKQLDRAGIAAAAIHGNRSQAQRTRALSAFADGKVQALVATDVAARGIHVDDVAVVVHFDPPGSDKDYIHRSGRTGRAGRAGVVVSFVDSDQHKAALALQRQLGLDAPIERADVPGLQRERTPRRRTRPAARPTREPRRARRVRR
jgi:superfamily II DNA/RNA helicase